MGHEVELPTARGRPRPQQRTPCNKPFIRPALDRRNHPDFPLPPLGIPAIRGQRRKPNAFGVRSTPPKNAYKIRTKCVQISKPQIAKQSLPKALATWRRASRTINHCTEWKKMERIPFRPRRTNDLRQMKMKTFHFTLIARRVPVSPRLPPHLPPPVGRSKTICGFRCYSYRKREPLSALAGVFTYPVERHARQKRQG